MPFHSILSIPITVSPPSPFIPSPIPIYPSLSPLVHLVITLIFSLFYALLFIYAYWQLWLVYCLGYKRISYQTAFLSLCLLFTSLRLLLFSFYIEGGSGSSGLANWAYGLLIEAPIILQYFIFALITSFYSKVLCNAQYSTFSKQNYRIQIFVICSSIVFLLSNIITSALVREMNPAREMAPNDILIKDYILVIVRAVITDGLFIVLATILSYCLFQLSYIDAARLVVDVQGLTYAHIKLVVTCISLLFSLRAIYNIIALLAHWPGFPFNWVDVTEQVDFVSLTRGKTYISFILVLLFYEIVPAFIVLYLFAIPSPINAQKRCPLTCCSDFLYCCCQCVRLTFHKSTDEDVTSFGNPEWPQTATDDSTIHSCPNHVHVQINGHSGVRSPCGSVLTTSAHSDRCRINPTATRGPTSLLSSLVSPKSGVISAIPPVIQQEKSYFTSSTRSPVPPHTSGYSHYFSHSSSANSMAYVISPPRRSLLPPGYSRTSVQDTRFNKHRKSVSSVNEVTPVSHKFPHLHPHHQVVCAASDPSTRVASVANFLPSHNENNPPHPDGISTDASGVTTSNYLRGENTITEQHEDEQTVGAFSQRSKLQ